MKFVLLVLAMAGGVAALNAVKLRAKTLAHDGSQCTARGGTCLGGTDCPGGHWERGLCPGVPVCCVPGAAPANPPPSSGGAGPICLTFDDGPFPITADILAALRDLKVKATWFMNCHKDGSTPGILRQLAQDGHLFANHMCSHDIMTVGQYGSSYGATMAQADGNSGCLATDVQKKLFTENVQGTIDLYSKMAQDNGFSLPARAFQLHRFPGDGRFMKCLVARLQDPALVKVPNIRHLGWTYEIAPDKTFGHVKEQSGVAGLSATLTTPPRAGSVILAHDLHYRNKVNLLSDWVKNQLARGMRFELPQPDGSCV